MGGSTNAAKDLLARSMEESRVRASEMPEVEPRFSFDIKGFIREIGIKQGGMVLGMVVGVAGFFWIMSNMMSHKTRLPPLGYVTGTLTIGGKPAAGVKVILAPIDRSIEKAKKTESARDSYGVTDLAGNFTMYYSEETEGVKVGPCRLSMEPLDPAIVIPMSYYGPASQHKVDVIKGNNPPQKIEL